jgi:MSHA pilin protein MshD
MPSNLRPGKFLHQERGFTLIELIMAIVLLGFVSLIMVPLVNSIRHSPDPLIRQRGLALGQALLDEITAKKWDENAPLGGGPICTPESPDQATRPSLIDNCLTTATPVASLGSDGESRVDYDDVDDYQGLTSTDNFVDQNNASFTLKGYSRSVQIDYITSTAATVTATTPVALGTTSDTKRIVVSVTTPSQETLVLVALACNY